MKPKYKSVIDKSFMGLLPVQIIIITVSSINSIIDGVVASRFAGPDALAVIALFLPVVKTLETVNTIFLGGSQILCGQYIGKNKIRQSSSVFSTDMLFTLIIGLAAGVVCCAFCGGVASLFVKDLEIIRQLSDYIRGYSFGIIPMLLVPQLTAFLQMERRENRTYIGMAAMIVLNITLDVLFVSVFKMGMFGLGLATSIANFAFFAVMAGYYLFRDSVIKLDFRAVDPKEVKNIIRIGFPGAVNNLGQTVRSILLNIIMLTFVGNDGISAFSAVYAFGCLFWAASGGVSNAVRILSSIYAGEEDRTGLHTIMKTALTRGLGLISAVAVACMLLSPVFTRFFYGPEAGAVYKMTLTGFLLFPITMPFSCLCCVFSAYYQCLDRMKPVNILTFADGLFGVIAFGFLLAPLLGMTGVWLAHIANGLLTTLIILVYTVLFNGHMPKTLEDLLVLKEDFGVSPQDRIDIAVRDMNGVIDLSESIIAFSRAHGIDERRAMISGLCIEEMTGNIVSHGFDGKKDYNIDVRVVYKEGSLLIRLKDNCRLFNPKEVQDLFDPEDVTHNVGLRLVSKIAESMSYNNALGINVLTITI